MRPSKAQTRALNTALREVLNEWDPIGVGPAAGGPDDEYDCLEGPLAGRLARGDGAEEISEFLRSDLADHFGLEDAAPPDSVVQAILALRVVHLS